MRYIYIVKNEANETQMYNDMLKTAGEVQRIQVKYNYKHVNRLTLNITIKMSNFH